jgi:acyl-CoA thioester hydrolase
MKLIRTFQGTIYPWHCDHMGHMNVQFYVAKFDEAVWNLFSRLGLTLPYLKENKRGMVALEQHLYYYKEVFAGESIYIESEIVEMREKVILIKHSMFKLANDEKAAETTVTGLHIDTELRKALPLPSFVVSRARELELESD